nr:hypothetical protein [Tanacetum cinerariifolium]
CERAEVDERIVKKNDRSNLYIWMVGRDAMNLDGAVRECHADVSKIFMVNLPPPNNDPNVLEDEHAPTALDGFAPQWIGGHDQNNNNGWIDEKDDEEMEEEDVDEMEEEEDKEKKRLPVPPAIHFSSIYELAEVDERIVKKNDRSNLYIWMVGRDAMNLDGAVRECHADVSKARNAAMADDDVKDDDVEDDDDMDDDAADPTDPQSSKSCRSPRDPQ